MEDNKPNIQPIRCPICGNTELAYVCEYHKCIGIRIATVIFTLCTLLCFYFYIVNPKINELLIGTFFLTCLSISLYIGLLINESKTGVKAICPKCGHQWNI